MTTSSDDIINYIMTGGRMPVFCLALLDRLFFPTPVKTRDILLQSFSPAWMISSGNQVGSANAAKRLSLHCLTDTSSGSMMWERRHGGKMTKGSGKILSAVLFFTAVLVLLRWVVSIGGEEERSLIIALAESAFLVWAGVFFLRANTPNNR